MTVYELNRNQLDELKSAYFWSDDTHETIYGGDGLPILFPGDVPDDVIFREYADINFVDDDFSCSAHGPADLSDDCTKCENQERCQTGDRPRCPWEETIPVYNPNLK